MPEPPIQRLKKLLSEQKPVLMVGAGSSQQVQYPSWDELIDKLKALVDSPPDRPPGMEIIQYADELKTLLLAAGREDDYYNFLAQEFQPKTNGNNFNDFHKTLVRLGYCGITTTNYDPVLEQASNSNLTAETVGSHQSVSLDLCTQDSRLRILDFLRGLTDKREGIPYHDVLHLHGLYDRPRDIVLTLSDYKKKYGEGRVVMEGSGPTDKTLDSLHRKVLWSLLVMHPVVFVGFSLNDGYFKHILGIFRSDFRLGSKPCHFAFLPLRAETPEERARDEKEISDYLKPLSVEPIFYEVQKREVAPGQVVEDHTKLQSLIFELANSLGITVGSPDLGTLNNDMLRRE